MDFFNISMMDFYKSLMVMFRTGAMIMTVPVFGHVAIPRLVKLWLILLLTVLIFPASTIIDVQPPSTSPQLVMLILSELAVGFLMGFAVVISFSAVLFAGHLVGLQMGLAMASMFDPLSAGQISVIGQFYYFLCLLVYLAINGHHYMLESLVRSFELVPIGAAVFGQDIGTLLIDMTMMLFVVGVKLIAPILITLFITNSIIGIVARTVPQMNVFIVGFPLAIGVGFAMIGASLPFFYGMLNKAFTALENDIAKMILMLQG